MSCACCEHSHVSLTGQTLQELDFERGIWSAARDGDIVRLEAQLKKGIDANSIDGAGYTALHYASRFARRNRTTTSFNNLCRSGSVASCRVLIECGACVNATLPSGATPLHRACYAGHVDVVQLLLDHSARTEIQDCDGMTCLHKAALSGNAEIILKVKHRNPNLIHIPDKQERTPRDTAVQCGANEKIIELLTMN
eukprot:c4156_g1_i2.p1 GENE.c4156_g1_i2~~c4156_g1_i2.p1  ORF type:complete len:196 (-),score=2.72 c4156_g1_i2:11-598(-)